MSVRRRLVAGFGRAPLLWSLGLLAAAVAILLLPALRLRLPVGRQRRLSLPKPAAAGRLACLGRLPRRLSRLAFVRFHAACDRLRPGSRERRRAGSPGPSLHGRLRRPAVLRSSAQAGPRPSYVRARSCREVGRVRSQGPGRLGSSERGFLVKKLVLPVIGGVLLTLLALTLPACGSSMTANTKSSGCRYGDGHHHRRHGWRCRQRQTAPAWRRASPTPCNIAADA